MKFEEHHPEDKGRNYDFFTGEIMTCHICGCTKKSNPEKSSGWTIIQFVETGELIYYCPTCFSDSGRWTKWLTRP